MIRCEILLKFISMFVLINTFQQVLLISATNTYNITDCYSQDSEVIVNKNTLRITVKLQSSNNSECKIFPSDVGANLTFGSVSAPQVLYSVTDDFSYENTSEIYFDIQNTNVADENYLNTSQFNSEKFAILQVYTYGYQTQIQIFRLKEQRSALSNCYNGAQSTLYINSKGYVVELNSTRLCSTQISNLVKVVLQIDSFQVDFGSNEFKDQYNSSGLKSYQKDNDTSVTKYLVLPSAKLVFTSNQGATQVSFQVTLNQIKYNQGENSPYLKFGVFASARQFMIFIFVDDEKREEFQAKWQAEKYDNIQFGISMLINYTRYRIYRTFSEFDINWQIVRIQCYKGLLDDQQQCFTLLNIIQTNYPSVVTCDILFQKKGVKSYYISENAQYFPTNTSEVFLNLVIRQNEFQFIPSNNVKSMNFPEQLQVYPCNPYGVDILFKHSFAIKATSRSALIYSFQCSSSSDKGDCEKAIKTKYDSYKLDIDDYIFLKIDMHYAMVIKAFKQEYTASQSVSIIIGMIGLCCVLGYATYELYATCITIKNLKSKKLK